MPPSLPEVCRSIEDCTKPVVAVRGAARAVADGFELDIGIDAPMALHCRLLINAAGLDTPAVARAIDGMPLDRIPTAYYAKGNYGRGSTRAPVARLREPGPEPGGRGGHLTRERGGKAKAAPRKAPATSRAML